MIETQLDHESLAAELLKTYPVLHDKIVAATGLTGDQVAEMLREVLRFLELTASIDGVLTPPHILDLAWHEFILFTRPYARFCEQHFGRFIHHMPGGTQSENRSQLRRTLKLYALAYGAPDPAYWGEHGYLGEPTNCGACEG